VTRAASALESAAVIPGAPLSILTRLRDLYESNEDWAALDRTFARLVERHAQAGDAESAWSTCRRIALLRTNVTRDMAGALEAWEGVLRCKQDDFDARERLASLLLERGDDAAGVEQLSTVVRADALRASAHEKLLSVFTRTGNHERAWLTAVALEVLGVGDMDSDLLVGQHRIDTPVRFESPVGAQLWAEGLLDEGIDPIVTELIAAVGPAAVRARAAELRTEKKLLALDPARRQPPTSTVSAVRSFLWASQVLSLPAPDLYVMDEVPGGVAAIAALSPTTALGPLVLKGMTAKRLAFVAGRHLTYYRPEFYPLIFFPTVLDLSHLLLAAVVLGLPELAKTTPGEALRLSTQIAKVIDDGERQRLADAVRAFDAKGGKADLVAWVRGVELTAARAGLLLAGDLAPALAQLDGEERHVGDVSLDVKRRDLVGYGVSARYADLRARLGLSVRS
jgi:hypothetical protein